MGYQEVQALQQQINSQLSSPKGGIGLDVQSWQGGAPLRQQPQKSVLGLLDRAKYGFADDIGQQQIIMNATGKRPIKLQNGQYGVEDIGPNGQKVIRPVDPKGFQMNDLVGDISESLGKGITTGGGILGGITGSVPGAGAGAGAGELVRQQIGNLLGVRGTEVEPGKFAKTGFGQMDNEDFAEIAGESILGAAGQGVANSIGTGLKAILNSSVVKGAKSAIDPGIKTSNANIIAKGLGVNNANSDIIQEGLEKGYKIYNDMGDITGKVDAKLIDLVENKNKYIFQTFLEPELKKTAAQQGVENIDEIAIGLQPTRKALGSLKKILGSNKLLKGLNKESIDEVNYYRNLISQTPETTYGDFKQIGNEISSKIKQAFDTSDYKKAEILEKIYDTFVDSRMGSLSETAPEAFKSYSKSRGTLDNLSKLFRAQLSEGELKPGQAPLVGKLGKFTKEVQVTNYNKLKQILDSAKDAGLPGANELRDDIGEYLYNFALDTAKRPPGSIGKIVKSVPILSGVAQVATEPFTNARGQARILQGLLNMGVLDKSQIGKQVSQTVIPRVQTMTQLFNARRALDMGTPLDEVLKQVSKPVGKVIKATLNKAIENKQGIQGQLAAKSLNQILFKGDMTNE